MNGVLTTKSDDRPADRPADRSGSSRFWAALRWMALGALVPALLASLAQSDPVDEKPPVVAEPSAVPSVSSLRRTPVVDVVEKSSPAIVAIEVIEAGGSTFESAGSGVFINARGFVLTNYHVVRGAARVRVRLASGETEGASMEALSESSDLALLALTERRRSHPHLRLGSSGDLLPGETVVAIGNPFGFQHTVSTGVVSAVRRRLRLPDGGARADFIQTDAAINPGNSGGALLNLEGDLIGVNSAIFGQGWGLAFAIPVDRIKQLLAEYVRREYAMGFDTKRVEGVLRVDQVAADGAANRAGVLAGDTLLFGNGQRLEDEVDLVMASLGATPSHPLRLHVERDGRELAFEVGGIPLLWSRFGLRGRDSLVMSDGVSRSGVTVDGLMADGRAARCGLHPGDVIQRVTVDLETGLQDYRVRTCDDLVVIAERYAEVPLVLVLRRDGQELRLRFDASE